MTLVIVAWVTAEVIQAVLPSDSLLITASLKYKLSDEGQLSVSVPMPGKKMRKGWVFNKTH